MNNSDCLCNDSIDKCDIFDFMSKYVGLSVLHPGGFNSTKKLLNKFSIDNTKRVLDIACGKGTTSIMIAKKYGCEVVGVDICPDLINEAKNLAKRNRVEHLIDFQVADATSLPFDDNTFDATISQAMLVLIENKESVIKETLRVLKSTGLAGWIELTWKTNPTDKFLQQVSDVICAYCMLNVKTSNNWEKLFIDSGAQQLETEIFSMDFNGFSGMIKDEGLINSIRVIKKYITDKKIQERMNTMNRFFKQHDDFFGYGIYTMKKNKRSLT